MFQFYLKFCIFRGRVKNSFRCILLFCQMFIKINYFIESIVLLEMFVLYQFGVIFDKYYNLYFKLFNFIFFVDVKKVR